MNFGVQGKSWEEVLSLGAVVALSCPDPLQAKAVGVGARVRWRVSPPTTEPLGRGAQLFHILGNAQAAR